jgi:hypothetical protein
LDATARKVSNEVSKQLLAILLTVGKTVSRGHQRERDQKVVVEQELAHNQVCRKGQLMWAQNGG